MLGWILPARLLLFVALLSPSAACSGSDALPRAPTATPTEDLLVASQLEDAEAPRGELMVAVSAGPNHTCGLRESGELACWGLNYSGIAEPPAGEFTSVDSGLLKQLCDSSLGDRGVLGRIGVGGASGKLPRGERGGLARLRDS